MVVGGFINVVFYLLAIVNIIGVFLSLDDFEIICYKVFVLCDFKFFGKYVIINFYVVGGIFQVMKILLVNGIFYGDVLMIIGQIIVEVLVDIFD